MQVGSTFVESMWDEIAFIEALSKTSGPNTEALKTLLKKLPAMARPHAKPIGAALGGASAATLAGYLLHRPSKKTGLSAEQKSSRWATEDLKRGEPGMARDSALALAEGGKRLSDVMSKHPVKAGLSYAPAGAMAGLKILKALKG